MDKILKNLKVNSKDDIQLSVQLAEQLTWLIVSGRIKVGEKLPAVRKLADQLGINLHTVRSAYRKMENTNMISTRQGVGSIVLGYDLYEGSQRAIQSRTNTIGLIIPQIGMPFYQDVLKGVDQIANEYGLLVIVCNTNQNRKKTRAFLEMLIAKQVDGIILGPLGFSLTDQGKTGHLENTQSAVPIIYVDHPRENHEYSVTIENEKAGYQATQYLIKRGHKKIAIIANFDKHTSVSLFAEGYLRALQENNIDQDESFQVDIKDFSLNTGYQAGRKILGLPEKPTAIFAISDLVSIGCIRAIRESGLIVPDDISIVSTNDSDLAAFSVPPLTTVNISPFEMGKTGMKMLFKLIEGAKVSPKKVSLPTKLIVRESCRSFPD